MFLSLLFAFITPDLNASLILLEQVKCIYLHEQQKLNNVSTYVLSLFRNSGIKCMFLYCRFSCI
jgi:hypothetical protein